MKRLRLAASRQRTAPVDPIPDRKKDPVVPADNGAPVGAASQGLIFVIAFGVVFVFVAFVAGMYVAGMKANVIPVTTDESDIVEVDEVIVDEVADDIAVAVDSVGLSIEWFSVESQSKSGMNSALHKAVFKDFETAQFDESPLSIAYTLGMVRGGDYDGYRLTQQIAALPGLGTFYETYYLLIKDGNLSEDVPGTVLVDAYASSIHDMFTGPRHWVSATEQLGETRAAELQNSKIFIDRNVRIAEFEHEDQVNDANGRTLNLVGMWQRVDFPSPFSATDEEMAVTLEDGKTLHLYEGDEVPAGTNQFYRVREDGRLLFYDVDVPFLAAVNEEDVPFPSAGFSGGIPQITWNDGSINTALYLKGELGGCGFSTITNVMSDDELDQIRPLVVVGTAPVGVDDAALIYEPESYNKAYYNDMFNVWTMDDDLPGDKKLTYEDFAGTHPYVYYSDSFGRWVELMHGDVAPSVECGKPVIYLYPERTMNMTVRVAPAGGFTKTEPAYRDGWRVTARPDGRLVNRDDGREYPYLFWEGRGGMYAAPSEYWVVAREDVPKFLRETLGALGLNERETNDFVEFWTPRMQAAPWYKVGFHGTRVMDALAPMSLSVSPQSVLRLLMDYEELDASMTENPPRFLPRFERRGFTVVEWGGVLR